MEKNANGPTSKGWMELYSSKNTINIIKRSNIYALAWFSLPELPLTKSKLESHKKKCQNKDFCNVIMSSEDTKTILLLILFHQVFQFLQNLHLEVYKISMMYTEI